MKSHRIALLALCLAGPCAAQTADFPPDVTDVAPKSVVATKTPVPEPSVALAMILGTAGMLWLLRRRG